MSDFDPNEVMKRCLETNATGLMNVQGRSAIRDRHFRCQFSRQTAPPDGPIQTVEFDGIIKNITVIREETRRGTVAREFIRLSYQTEDIEFRRNFCIELSANGKAFLVETAKGINSGKYECEFRLQ